MASSCGLYLSLLLGFCVFFVRGGNILPLVITTWEFRNATKAAWDVIIGDNPSIDALQIGITKCEVEQCHHAVGFGGKTDETGETTLDAMVMDGVISTANNTALDAVETGCAKCETMQCDGSVGYGGSPDEDGETELDAMIMDGITHDVGAVGCLRNVKNAIGVARAVMDYTEQTFLVGDLATEFAISMGFQKEDLHTNRSIHKYEEWKAGHCQPNFRQNVKPDPKLSCGPYKPQHNQMNKSKRNLRFDKKVDYTNHDTIGMVVIDENGNVATGTSTNGLNHKIPGRVGDSPIAGAGSYADNEFGGAAATGDGDVMMRFLPSFNAVSLLGMGVSPCDAAKRSIRQIIKYYPDFMGAVIVADIKGNYGAACHGLPSFPYVVQNPSLPHATVMSVSCI